jgi:hypothetical protein
MCIFYCDRRCSAFDNEDEYDVGKLQVMAIVKPDSEARDRIPCKKFANAGDFSADLLLGGSSYALVVSGKPLGRHGVAVIHSDYFLYLGSRSWLRYFIF